MQERPRRRGHRRNGAAADGPGLAGTFLRCYAAPNPVTYVDNPHILTDPLGLAPCDENDVTWGGRVRYGAPGPGGRATTKRATIQSDMTGGRTNRRVKVPGYQNASPGCPDRWLQQGPARLRHHAPLRKLPSHAKDRRSDQRSGRQTRRHHRVHRHAHLPHQRPHRRHTPAPDHRDRSSGGFTFTPYEGCSQPNVVTVMHTRNM